MTLGALLDGLIEAAKELGHNAAGAAEGYDRDAQMRACEGRIAELRRAIVERFVNDG